MEAIKQILKVSKDHEIKVKVPQYIPDNELVEMILIIKKTPDSFNRKIKQLKEAVKDKLFLSDLKEITEDFKTVDLQGWEWDLWNIDGTYS